MIPSQLLQNAVSHHGFRPLAGRCIIELDETPTLIGLLHIPDSARGLRAITEVSKSGVSGDKAYTGKVLAMTPRKDKSGTPGGELFKVGDKVWVLLLMEDLEEKVICTRVERVYAVLDETTKCSHQADEIGAPPFTSIRCEHCGAFLKSIPRTSVN